MSLNICRTSKTKKSLENLSKKLFKLEKQKHKVALSQVLKLKKLFPTVFYKSVTITLFHIT